MTLHPDVHEPWRRWSEEATLHVACAYSNPLRWRTRRVLMNDFRQHMQSSPNVALHAGELAYGDRPFEVTGDYPGDVQLRTSHELWHKENLLNIVVQRFPADWEYGAVIDADFHMTRRDWALEAIHQLQHFDFVQLFSSYTDLSAKHTPYRVMPSFAWTNLNGGAPSRSRVATNTARAPPAQERRAARGRFAGAPSTRSEAC